VCQRLPKLPCLRAGTRRTLDVEARYQGRLSAVTATGIVIVLFLVVLFVFKALWRHGPTEAGIGLEIAPGPGRIRGASTGPGAFYLLLVVAAVGAVVVLARWAG
jgi:hypothetical protein